MSQDGTAEMGMVLILRAVGLTGFQSKMLQEHNSWWTAEMDKYQTVPR